MSENQNLFALLENRFAEAGEQIAIEDDNRQITLSYADLLDRSGQYANALLSLGVAPGDRVTVQTDKSLESVFLYLGTLRAGAVYQPLNTAYTGAEVEYFISDAEPKVVVCRPQGEEQITALTKDRDASVVTLGNDGTGSLAELAQSQNTAFVTVERVGDDLAGLLYTSGTTGRSKGAMLTHDNLASNAVTLHRYWGFVPGDVLLHALPVFHVHGLFVALNIAFLNMSRIIWHDRFDAARVIADLPRASVLMGVPTFYVRMLGQPDFGREQCAGMRLFIAGSAPLLAETHTQFAECTGHKILERYGMTETGMITSNPYDGERIAGTVGYALPGINVRIADDDGNEVPRGEVGVIEVKGPNVFAGYWRMPEKTTEEFRHDGYFITGDMALMAEDGRIMISGRAKDLIISGGFNVYPKEIELVLDEYDAIGESAVIGVPHPDFGEGVVAVVTPGSSDAFDEAAICTDLAGRLAKFKVPKRIFMTDVLPRNAMGKVQKAELRAKFQDCFTAAKPM
ncbi:MAG: malonyl-CoA synthase [Hyphomicrobiales bacterium]|nr:malonyl-CoA synthase [Hyphomicrobiales bacterium]